MGFPAAYSEIPRLLLNLLFLLGLLRRLSSWLLRLVGAGIDDDYLSSFDYSDSSDYFPDHHHQDQQHDNCGLEELEKHSPALRFDALPSEDGGDGTPALLSEGCAVCLADFHGAALVRRPRGCRHVFHSSCLDRWAAHGHRTCPLCRATLLLPPPLPLPAS